jgi:hypothetical protein
MSLKMELFITTGVRTSISKHFNLFYMLAFSFLKDQYCDIMAGKNKNMGIGPEGVP